jgi:hypothetical protein
MRKLNLSKLEKIVALAERGTMESKRSTSAQDPRSALRAIHKKAETLFADALTQFNKKELSRLQRQHDLELGGFQKAPGGISTKVLLRLRDGLTHSSRRSGPPWLRCPTIHSVQVATSCSRSISSAAGPPLQICAIRTRHPG